MKITALLFISYLLLVQSQSLTAQCENPGNIAPEDINKLEWANFLDTAERYIIIRLNEIRANPSLYAETVITKNLEKTIKDSEKEWIASSSNTVSYYRTKGCEQQVYKKRIVKGEDAYKERIQEQTKLLEKARKTEAQPPLLLCLELTQSASDYRKNFMQLKADGMSKEDVLRYEDCNNKYGIRKNWGTMSVHYLNVYQSPRQSLPELLDFILSGSGYFNEFINSPSCAIGLRRCKNPDGGHAWFFCFSTRSKSPDYTSKKPKKM